MCACGHAPDEYDECATTCQCGAPIGSCECVPAAPTAHYECPF